MTKECNKCKAILPIERFSPHRNSHLSTCKSCRNSLMRDRLKNNPLARSHHLKLVSSRKEKLRQELDELKNRPCLDCGGTFPPECMDFDHVSGIKLDKVSTLFTHHSRDKVKTELQKCELVCANCHRIRTKRRAKVKE